MSTKTPQCCCIETEGDEFCPVHCCGDHSNLCSVAESEHDACCDDCPEFVKAARR